MVWEHFIHGFAILIDTLLIHPPYSVLRTAMVSPFFTTFSGISLEIGTRREANTTSQNVVTICTKNQIPEPTMGSATLRISLG